MGFELLVGPPASGKTRCLLERAHELTSAGRRVWWAGLPAQRASVYRRATSRGALLGLEFQTLQQVYYRLLAHARHLRPLLVGTGRLALVGEALARDRNALPSPGEARLFAAAIAELKRFGVDIDGLTSGEAEVERLRRVYGLYERLKGQSWDYDDFRREAVALAEAGSAAVEADALFVDGFREISPLDLRLLRALGEGREVRLALPEAPEGLTPDAVLVPERSPRIVVHGAPNTVTEVRWVLRSLKRDLAQGIDPLDLAVILPASEMSSFKALADEYGVPLLDERPVALADTAPGRVLLTLLELSEHPTATRLLVIGELAPLAAAARARGVAGHAAIAQLATSLGLGDRWHAWLERLAVRPERAPALVDVALGLSAGETPLQAGEPGSNAVAGSAGEFREAALARAKEAARVAQPPGFRDWWSALLREAALTPVAAGGVVLADDRLASGRRFRRAYLVRANSGSYPVAEREDYFVPEEDRAPLARLFEGTAGVLPRRLEAHGRLLLAELRSRGDETVITYAAGEAGGALLPEPALLAGATPGALPNLPAGSPLELDDGSEPYRDVLAAARLGSADIEELRQYDECAMRYWLSRRTVPPPTEWWRELTAAMHALGRPTADELEELERRHPRASEWLAANRATLQRLRFGVAVGDGSGEGPRARLDAMESRDEEVTIYHFAAPDAALTTSAEAAEHVEKRWSELWAAGCLLQRFPREVRRVRIVVWPILGEPSEAYPGGIRSRWKRIEDRAARLASAAARFESGSIEPAPGYQCRHCGVRDACRHGAHT